jgi:hypothetical protein
MLRYLGLAWHVTKVKEININGAIAKPIEVTN